MEAAHHHAELTQAHHAHEHGSEEAWHDEEYVAHWLEGQDARAAERRRQFVTIRAMIPKLPNQEFTYLNIGAGPGNLDEVLLEHFHGAQATLVDVSLAMLEAARKRLQRFGDRVEYVQANLASPEWAAAVGGPFDCIVSSIAIHHLPDPRRIRELYAETMRLLVHGGIFLNLDYVRPARPSLADLATWAARDPEAGFFARGAGAERVGTVNEQLGWLSEAGYPIVDVLWKDLRSALFCGVRDHLHLPDDSHSREAASEHAHSHEHSH